jgi:hypothetical protein
VTVAVSIADHMQAIVDHLADFNVGYSAPPEQHGWDDDGPPGQTEFIRYGIAWRVGSKDRIRWSLQGDFSEAYLLVYIRCFGDTAAAAEAHLDAVAARMLARDDTGWALTVPARAVLDIRQDNGSTTTESTTTEAGYWEAGDFFAIRTDPEG